MEIEESTLYPLLHRLEHQGLLVSEWREVERRRRRFYRLSPDGARLLKQLVVEWQAIDTSLADIFKEKSRGADRSLRARR
jgi:PadR family transcriptional regulator PadR